MFSPLELPAGKINSLTGVIITKTASLDDSFLTIIITLFENYSKCRILIFDILAFSNNFCPIKSDLFGNSVRPKLPK